jgi:transposase
LREPDHHEEVHEGDRPRREVGQDRRQAYRRAWLPYRFTASREDIAAKSVLSALAQLETLRQQLAAHIEHTKEMRHTLGVVIECKAATKSLEHIEKQIAAHPTPAVRAGTRRSTCAANMRGISLEQASVLMIALRDKTFVDRDQLVAFVGLDVRVRQSGKWIGRQVLSKRGNGYLRKILFQVGWSLYMNNDEYRAAYMRMRARGKNYKTCIIALARKFLRFLFAFYWKKTVVFAHEQQPAPAPWSSARAAWFC